MGAGSGRAFCAPAILSLPLRGNYGRCPWQPGPMAQPPRPPISRLLDAARDRFSILVNVGTLAETGDRTGVNTSMRVKPVRKILKLI